MSKKSKKMSREIKDLRVLVRKLTKSQELLIAAVESRMGTHVVVEISRDSGGDQIERVVGMFSEEQAVSWANWKKEQGSPFRYVIIDLEDVEQFERVASENAAAIEDETTGS